MTLRISLRDGEKVIVNGAVLRSTGRTDLCVENSASVLRGRDVMTSEEATTPARRLYFVCMLAYIGEGDVAALQGQIVDIVGELIRAFEAPEARAACVSFAQKVAMGQYYRALGDCRWLITYEKQALDRLQVAAS